MSSTRTTALVVVAMCVGAMLMFGFNKWNGFGSGRRPGAKTQSGFGREIVEAFQLRNTVRV